MAKIACFDDVLIILYLRMRFSGWFQQKTFDLCVDWCGAMCHNVGRSVAIVGSRVGWKHEDDTGNERKQGAFPDEFGKNCVFNHFPMKNH